MHENKIKSAMIAVLKKSLDSPTGPLKIRKLLNENTVHSLHAKTVTNIFNKTLDSSIFSMYYVFQNHLRNERD